MTTDLSVSEMSAKDYKIVYEAESYRSWIISNEIKNLQTALNNKGITVEDSEIYSASTATTDYEIVIGETDRKDPECPNGISNIDEYVINPYPNKIYLHAGSTYALQAAIIELESMIKNGTVESVSGVYSESVSAYTSTDYKLVWASEFNDADTVSYNSNGIVTSVKGGWTVKPISINTSTTTGGNRYYGKTYMVGDKDTCYVSDGSLIMRAIKLDDTANNHYDYSTSAGWTDNLLYKNCYGIETGTTRYNYGYLEMRAKIPAFAGVYSSFWLTADYNKSTPSVEIDVFENGGTLNRLNANIHWWNLNNAANQGSTLNKPVFEIMHNYKTDKNAWSVSYDNGTAFASHLSSKGYTDLAEYYKTPSPRYTTYNGVNLSDEYHTIGLYWTREKIEFLLDGKVYTTQDIINFKYPDGTHAHDDQFMKIFACLNVGWYGRTQPSDSIFNDGPIEYQIDYIRLYQIDGQSIKY